MNILVIVYLSIGIIWFILEDEDKYTSVILWPFTMLGILSIFLLGILLFMFQKPVIKLRHKYLRYKQRDK